MAFLPDGTPIVFFNICWHGLYQGPISGDETDSGHEYFSGQGKKFGEECYTFLPDNGRLYFHAPFPEDKTININNLGANSNDCQIDGVLLVFISTSAISKKQHIVGWYKNAIIYRKFKKWPNDERKNQDGGSWYYIAETYDSNGYCVPNSKRFNFDFPKEYKFRSIWYADDKNDPKQKKFCNEVYEYILNYEEERKNVAQTKIRRSSERTISTDRDSIKHNTDQVKRKSIEDISMSMVMDFYDKKGYEVENVSMYSKGWDIEAFCKGSSLKIEVKGAQSNQIIFELTPNEYKMLKCNIYEYRIAVVTNCLSENPQIYIFKIRKNGNSFEGYNDNYVLSLLEKPGAVGRILQK